MFVILTLQVLHLARVEQNVVENASATLGECRTCASQESGVHAKRFKLGNEIGELSEAMQIDNARPSQGGDLDHKGYTRSFILNDKNIRSARRRHRQYLCHSDTSSGDLRSIDHSPGTAKGIPVLFDSVEVARNVSLWDSPALFR